MKHVLSRSLGSLSLGLALAVAATPVLAQDTAVPAQDLHTDSSGIPFGTIAGQSPLYVPVTVDGAPMTAATNSGRVQVTSKLALAPIPVPAEPAAQAEPTDPEIARGKYLTTAADCAVCHSSAGGKPFAGGLPFKTPFGTMFSSNITPDKATGIGGWTEQQFIDAVKHGKRNDGANLYPSMPYTSYVKLSDGDVKAIYAYLKTVPAVDQMPPENEMGFPYNQRWVLSFWNLLNFGDTGFSPEPGKDEAYNRGAYVATALGHCAECHTPRDLTMGLKTSRNLAGASIDGWLAYNISPSVTDGIGSWSQADIVTYLKTGALPGKATAAGPMAEVISNSTRLMTDQDLNDLAIWLKAQPAQGAQAGQDRFSQGAAFDSLAADVRGQDPGTTPSGAILFNANCAACHGVNGAGVGASLYYPSLFHNSATGAAQPDNLVQVILNGVRREDAAGHDIVMPAFGADLSSGEVASLANYVTKVFGNGQQTVTAQQVDTLRSNAVMVIPGWILVAAGVVGALIAWAVAIWLLRRRRA